MKRKVLTILRQQAVVNPAAERAEKVYEWVSHLTAESRYASGNFGDYYIPKDGRRLYFKLKHMKDGLIGVVGLQGVGKTALLKNLANDLTNALFFRWKQDWQIELEDMKQKRHGVKIKRQLDTFPEDSIAGYLLNFLYLFIDFPDYSKKSRANMNKDLRDVENLWKTMQERKERIPHSQVMVLGIQKEMFGGHFFFGKMDIVELSPLKPEEMLEAYKKKWQDTEPFTPEALLLVAELSRGIFRRFLKYIQRCIEETTLEKKGFPITVESVKEAVTLNQLMKDMDLELSELFTNKEQKMLAVKLLNCIREHKQINQTKIAELLDASDMAVSRMVGKLEAYGYIKRERGLHAEWLVSLA